MRLNKFASLTFKWGEIVEVSDKREYVSPHLVI